MSTAVVSVGDLGIATDRGSIAWDVLRAVAHQEDVELSAAYRRMLSHVEDVALTRSPLRVVYGRDSSGVWYRAHVVTAWGGVEVGRAWRGLTIVAADEGGTLAHEWMARDDARQIAERIRAIAPTHDVRVVPGDVP
jgi:hypothetical protein